MNNRQEKKETHTRHVISGFSEKEKEYGNLVSGSAKTGFYEKKFAQLI